MASGYPFPRVAALVALLLAACASNANSLRSYAPVQLADGHAWISRNLDIEVTPSFCYADDDANCRSFGRLYPWESARRACSALGAGWRLPTDVEWRELANRCGGVSDDAVDGGRASYANLTSDARSAFNAQLGGGRGTDGTYTRLNAHGFYWTDTRSDPGGYWYYNFAAESHAVHRQDGGDPQRAFSVRCIHD